MMSSAPEPMPHGQRAYVIAMCAIIAAAFAYAASDWGRWPRLTYHPLSGEVGLAPTSSLSIVYLGNVAWGLGGLACGAAAGALLCRLAPRAWPARALQLFGAWALTAVLLAGSYFTWSLWPW